MAVPIILGGIAAAAGVTGLYKGIKGAVDNSNASDLNDEAQNIVSRAESKLESAKNLTEETLKNLGQAKIDILAIHVQKFLDTFQKIKNVDFQHDGNIGSLSLKNFDIAELSLLKQEVSFVVTSGLGVVGGATGGALTAFGAYNGVMLLGTASTGKAIGALGGIAAKNATLAWLGGGSLATGGGGMALGSMVLTGVAAGPALLLAGWYMGAKASENLDNARSNKAQAEAYKADVEATITTLDGLNTLTNKFIEVLSKLKMSARRNLKSLNEVIETQGVDYSSYDDEAKKVVMLNVKIMQLIKAMLDIAILDQDGNILNDAESNIYKVQSIIQNNYEGAL